MILLRSSLTNTTCVLLNRIKTIYLHGLNKGFSSKLCIGSHVQQETPEQVRRMHLPKCCQYVNDDEVSSLNIVHNKNHQALSEKFRLIISRGCFML